MKLTDEQRHRIAEAMLEAEVAYPMTNDPIKMLAAGMRELARIETYKHDDWPEETTTASVLVRTAKDLEDK